MTTLDELERRLSALEAREAAELTDLKKRIATLERWKGESFSAFGKLLPIIEETHMRVSTVALAVEEAKVEIKRIDTRAARIESELGQIKAEQTALRHELPKIIAETMREVLAEQRLGEQRRGGAA